MVSRRVRLHLRAQQRVAQTVGERSKRAADVGADRARGRAAAAEAAECVPGPLAPAVIRDAVSAGHAGAAFVLVNACGLTSLGQMKTFNCVETAVAFDGSLVLLV